MAWWHARLLVVICCLTAPGFAVAATALLQPLIDATPDGETLVPAPGVYRGPVMITRPIILDGQGEVTIDSGGAGSVVVLQTDGATLRNLHLTNSGDSHNDIDAGVQVRGRFNIITDNIIDNCLFGVDLQQSENNIVRRNRISSKPFELGQRGDAIRLWYSFNNRVIDNEISNARDTVVWYSADNTISGNRSSNSRYSLHFMYAQFNQVEGNHYEDNAVGIFLMYSDGVVVKNNHIARATGPTGIGIGFKETSDVTIEGNRVSFSDLIDLSKVDPKINKQKVGVQCQH